MSPDDVRAGVTDLQALALTLMFEAGSEPVEGKIAVGCVVRNRVDHPKRFSDSYRGVCTARSQFSCWWAFGGAVNNMRLMAAATALVSGQPPPFTDLEAGAFRECWFLAEGIIGGQIRDNTRGALNYYAPLAMKPVGRVPDDAQGRPSIRVGTQIFYSAA